MKRADLLEVAKPILFNTEMVRAILDGRKTETRRVVPEKVLDEYNEYDEWCNCVIPPLISTSRIYEKEFFYGKSRYKKDDILYVRETWCRFECQNCEGDEYTGECINQPNINEGCYMYRATHNISGDARWRPSIHMPKEAARLFLQVTDIRAERLQDITIKEIAAEGVDAIMPDRETENICDYCPIEDSLKGIHCYGDNPVMCEGALCDDAMEHWEEEFYDEFANLWNGTIKKSGP